MNDKIKNIVVTIVLSVFFISFSLACFIRTPDEISSSERRKLAQLPAFTLSGILNGKDIEDFEDYTLDQFPLRDSFRSLKAFFLFNVMQQLDNNDIYIVGDSVSKLEYPLNESNIKYATDKFQYLYETYLKDQNPNVFYTIVPDKNYFLAEENGYPSLDYKKLVSLVKSGMSNMTYIDIFDCLTIDDYYRTDLHWRQEKLGTVAQRLANAMNKTLSATYETKQYSPFYGVYCGQSALTIEPDTLYYLTNDILENAKVFNHEKNTYEKIYTTEKLTGMDSYDVYLSGATPLLTIMNDNATTDKRLVIFRDSFGSSITPLLVEAYSQITVVDIRYVPSKMLGEYIDLVADDVLFLYSTSVLNNSRSLR